MPANENEFTFNDNHPIGMVFGRLNVRNSQTPYTYKNLVNDVKEPVSIEKDKCRCLAVHSAGVKTKDAIINHNEMQTLWVDLDNQDLRLGEVSQLLDGLEISGYIIYSTSSSCRIKRGTVQGKRWRVVIPMIEPVDLNTWLDLQQAITTLTGGDSSATRIQQILYLPNNPKVTSADKENGAIQHYEHKIAGDDSPICGANPPKAIADEINRQHEEVNEAKQLAKVELEKRPIRIKDDDNIIEKINAAFNIKTILTQVGYDYNGKAYRSPNSTSGGYGLYVLDDNRWLSFHGCDDTMGVNTPSCFCGDVFDLIAHHQYGGDFNKALKELADEVDPEGQRQRQRNYMAEKNRTIAVKVIGEGIDDFEPLASHLLHTELDTEADGLLKYQTQLILWMNERYALVFGSDGLLCRLAPMENKTHGDIGYIKTVTADNEVKPYGYPVELIDKKTGEVSLKIKPLYKEWISHHLRHSYSSIIMNIHEPPMEPGRKLPQTENLNLFTGFGFVPKKGDYSLIEKHIFETWANEDDNDYKYILDWLAFLVQNPDKKNGVALVVKSDGEGTGKGIIVDMFTQYFTTNHSHIVTDFNNINDRATWLRTAMLVFLNEATYGGSKAQLAKLNQMITDDFLSATPLYKEAIQFPNLISLLIATNGEWVAPVSRQSRRYGIFELSDKYMGDHEYFDRLGGCINSGGKEAFIHFLMQRDLSEVNLRKIPEKGKSASARFEQKLMGLSPEAKWLWDCLSNKTIWLDDGKNYSWGDSSLFLCKHALLSHIQTTGGFGARDITTTSLTKTFVKILGEIQTRRRILPKGADWQPEDGINKRYSGYEFPNHKEALSLFAEYVKTDLSVLSDLIVTTENEWIGSDDEDDF